MRTPRALPLIFIAVGAGVALWYGTPYITKKVLETFFT